MSGIASLPPHAFIEVMTEFLKEGGDLKELCSSSKAMNQKCRQMRGDIMLIRVRIFASKGDFRALYQIAKEWIDHHDFMTQMYYVINHSSFGYNYEPENVEDRFGLSEAIFNEAVETKNTTMMKKLGVYTRFQSIMINGRTTGSDPGQIRMSQWIRLAFRYKDIGVLKELVTLAQNVYGWSNRELFLYANIHNPEQAYLLCVALSYLDRTHEYI